MSIGDNIKKIREEHGMTQADLGKICGVSDKAISTWETGFSRPRVGSVQRMAEYFHISRDSILAEDFNYESAVRTFDIGAEAMLRKYEKLTDKQKERLKAYADFLLLEDE